VAPCSSPTSPTARSSTCARLADADTILLTEGEFKALAVTQAYRANQLSAPGLAHPGLAYLPSAWASQLIARGVRTVILAYDSGPRPVKDGLLQLAPEEIWSIRHGQALAAAGLAVRVLRLPLGRGEQKADLDAFILAHGPARLQPLIDTAPALSDYHRALPRSLLRQARLPLAADYPLRRARPQRLAPRNAAPARPADALELDAARSQIADLVRDHALTGQGFLVLAHPPGAGKGHNTVAGLQAFLQAHPAPGQIVWTAPRKEQIRDQQGLALAPLHGRNPNNCHKLGAAQALSAKGYSVRDALCQRRCPHVDHCAYLQQFGVEADRFAPQPLLQATGWWQAAGVLVLDEFDPARLTRTVSLSSTDLAAMGRASACPHAHALLRWLGQLLGSAGDRTLPGMLMLPELEALARAEGLNMAQTLCAAEAGLPDEREQQLLAGLPPGATLADYESLPPNYLAVIIRQLSREHARARAGLASTSRLELGGGRLALYLRVEHLIAQLASPAQPKIILDATVSEDLLRSLFPTTPIRIARPAISGAARVVQVITRDWAKSTLRGERREQWYDAVAARIRPGRPTLVVCTLACESDLRQALAARGHPDVVVAHYGALRGSNAYKGHDVILAQVYHPNLDAIVREGRALFADDIEPLDERVVTTERILEDAAGARWAVPVPTFADSRLAALLEARREAELVQAALRGRSLDHPEVQITLLFGLPLPGLAPTEIVEDAGPGSNAGRQERARDTLAEAARGLLAGGKRVLSVEDLAGASGQSVVTVRRHMAAVAGRLGLRVIIQRRTVTLPQGGRRDYERMVLVRRGRWVPPPKVRAVDAQPGMDQADNQDSITCVIRPLQARPRRRSIYLSSQRSGFAHARRALRLRR
jgi:hypothetical protein